jgi:hypothetical protein
MIVCSKTINNCGIFIEIDIVLIYENKIILLKSVNLIRLRKLTTDTIWIDVYSCDKTLKHCFLYIVNFVFPLKIKVS